MKKCLPTLAAAALLTMAAPVALADDHEAYSISGNIALSTDYRFRGISQTDRDPAVSGGFDLETEAGFYAGVWASNVQFGGSIEIDYYAGYAGSLTDDVGFDLGYYYYNYPSDNSSPDLDYQEFAASLSYGDGNVGLIYSNDFFAETDTYWYLHGDYSFSLPAEWSLGLHVGINFFDEDGEFVDASGDTEDQYVDWSISLSREFAGVGFDISYIDTDLDDDFCGDDICDSTLVLTLSKSL